MTEQAREQAEQRYSSMVLLDFLPQLPQRRPVTQKCKSNNTFLPLVGLGAYHSNRKQSKRQGNGRVLVVTQGPRNQGPKRVWLERCGAGMGSWVCCWVASGERFLVSCASGVDQRRSWEPQGRTSVWEGTLLVAVTGWGSGVPLWSI